MAERNKKFLYTEEIQKFLDDRTLKMRYARLPRTDIAKKYGEYKKIPYSEALEKIKKCGLFEGFQVGGIMWKEKVNDKEIIEKCKKRKEVCIAAFKKKEAEKNEEEIEEKEEKIKEKILEKIKKLETEILEIKKNSELACKEKELFKKELEDLLEK